MLVVQRRTAQVRRGELSCGLVRSPARRWPWAATKPEGVDGSLPPVTYGYSVRTGARLSGLVDIHAHLLPGIDDGPRDLESALSMARAAVGAGIEVIAATPHLRQDFPDVHLEELAERSDSLRVALKRDQISLGVIGGAETSLAWALQADDQQLALASYGQRGTDLLIEAPSDSVIGFDRLVYELLAKGFRVTLAHPERNPEFQGDPDRLDELVSQGVLLQINADSLLVTNRKSPLRRLAERLCRDGIAHALASDGHRGESWRPVTRLAEAAVAATALVGAERARWLVATSPGAIISGEPVPEPPPITIARRRPTLFRRT